MGNTFQNNLQGDDAHFAELLEKAKYLRCFKNIKILRNNIDLSKIRGSLQKCFSHSIGILPNILTETGI